MSIGNVAIQNSFVELNVSVTDSDAVYEHLTQLALTTSKASLAIVNTDAAGTLISQDDFIEQ